MSNRELNIVLRLQDQVSNELKGVQGKLEEMRPTFQKMQRYGTVAFSAISGLIVKSGYDIDNASATIVKGTGAIGDELTELLTITRRVNTHVPQTMDEVSQAVADVATRFDLAGDELEELSTLSLHFARITGMDVSTSVRSLSRLMGDWGIDARNAEGLMDKLTVASQMSGIEINRLSDTMVMYGVQLRALGFEQDDAIALLAKFEKEGVATEKIFAGLSMALGRLAREGVDDTAEAFKMLTGDIEATGSVGEAVREAIDILGTRAGPDFALAVLEGRFAIDEYTEALTRADGALSQTAIASMTVGEQMRLLGQNIMEAIAPTDEMREKIAEVVIQITDWIRENPALVKTIIYLTGALAGLVAVVGTLGLIMLTTAPVIAALSAPVILITGLVLALAGAGIYLWRNWETAVTGMGLLWDTIKSIFKSGVQFVWDKLLPLLPGGLIIKGIVDNWDKVKHYFTLTLEAIVDVFSWAKDKIMAVLNPIIETAQKAIDLARRAREMAGGAISGARDRVSSVISKVTPFADGGIVTKPTLGLVGEAGPEAIIPLNRRGLSLGNINITISGNSFMGEEDMAEKVGDKIMNIIKQSTKI